MKKIKTLKMNYEFKNVLTKGKYFVGKQIIVYIMNNRYEYNRIGIAVSTKAGKAVKRNHIKRIIREGYKKYKDELKLSYDIIFMWNKKLKPAEVSYKIVQQDIYKAFSKAGILK